MDNVVCNANFRVEYIYIAKIVCSLMAELSVSSIRTNYVTQGLWLIRIFSRELNITSKSKLLKSLHHPVCRRRRESPVLSTFFFLSFTEKDTMDVWCNGEKMETAVRDHFHRFFIDYGSSITKVSHGAYL